MDNVVGSTGGVLLIPQNERGSFIPVDSSPPAFYNKRKIQDDAPLWVKTLDAEMKRRLTIQDRPRG